MFIVNSFISPVWKVNNQTPTLMVTKEFSKEVLEIAVSLKMKIEKYYEHLDKQVIERSNR